MRVGVVDVGSNTVRLLVASGTDTICRRRATLALGESIERLGLVPGEKLAEVESCVGEFVATARKKRAQRIEVLVTSPGRQAENAGDLLARIGAAGAPVRLLSSEEEASLAFLGAVRTTRGLGRKTVAVCDVGGGSAQVAVGTRRDGVAWTRSIDLGSRRLTSRLLSADPPGREAVERARAEVEAYLDGFAPPLPQVALAVGGSARAVQTLTGALLDERSLEAAVDVLAETPVEALVAEHGVDPARAVTLAAGAVILAALQHRLGVPLAVARGGLREGAVAELAVRKSAAA